MIRDILLQLPLWLRLCMMTVALIAISAAVERIALWWKSRSKCQLRPMHYPCHDLQCLEKFPAFWTDGPEPQRQKLEGWTKEQGNWYCRSHNAGQIPLPFGLEPLRPQSDEAQELADHLSRRKERVY